MTSPSQKPSKDYRWVFGFITVVMIVIDQLVKAWARNTFSQNLAALQGKPFPGIFELTLTYNRGIAFGLFQGHGVMLTPVAIFMAAMAGFYSFKIPKGHLGIQIAMGLLAAGALGNLYDRLFEGRVTDLFYFRLINFPVFNVADACITVSAILLMILWTLDSSKSSSSNEPSNSSVPVASEKIPDMP